MAPAAGCASLSMASVLLTLTGLTKTATRAARGKSSCNSSNCFATNSALKKLMPVRLPPGRGRLVTRPSRTGSSGTMKRIGIVVVAALAAGAAVVARGDYGDLSANKFGRQFRQSIVLVLGEA